ncbi:MAG: hypothetical protein ACRCYD_12735, partial [Plesiomonas sp.]
IMLVNSISYISDILGYHRCCGGTFLCGHVGLIYACVIFYFLARSKAYSIQLGVFEKTCQTLNGMTN